MRTIKFRGKSLENGEWVYGYIDATMYKDVVVIHSEATTYSVNPSTVGQFTGLTDTKGKEIYEGDLVETFIGNLEIIWSRGLACYRLQDGGGGLYSIDGMEMEVVGNIHDNPELLTE